MNKITRPVSPTLLQDTPAKSDQLGPHQRVANGIAKLIESSSGGKTIAIEGEWGTGKSTVVSLLADHFKDSETFVQAYDAWTHVGDPLRRAFITSLILELQSRKWISGDKDWHKDLEKLARRFKEVNRESYPTFAPFGKLLAVSLLIVPLGMPIFSEGLRSCGQATGCALAQLIFGALLATLPLTILGVVAIAHWFWGWGTDGVFALIINKGAATETTFSTESGDPTSLEFQALFARAMGQALLGESNSNRRLVLIIDNLDRLRPKEAHEIWSLLRSFIDNPEFKRHDWSSRIWIVVPIARPSQGEAALAGQAPLGPDDLNERPRDSDGSFLDKVFQARFVLPPAPLKNWNEHFRSLLWQAFPESYLHIQDEAPLVDVFMVYLKGKSPTPRELVLLVNQLVSLAVQWEQKFRLPVLAAYLLETQDGNILDRLRTGSVPTDSVRQILSHYSASTADYASLYFNTGVPAEALEILQRPIAEQILAEGNSAGLLKQMTSEPMFATVVRSVLTSSYSTWVQSDPTNFFNALQAIFGASDQTIAKTAEEAKAVADTSAALKVPALALAANQLSRVTAPPLLAKSFPIVATTLLDDETRDLAATCLALIARIGNDGQGLPPDCRPPDENNFVTWVDSALTVIAHPKILKLLPERQGMIEVPLTPNLFADLLHQCRRRGISARSHSFVPVSGSPTLLQYLIAQVSRGGIRESDAILYEWLSQSDGFDLGPYDANLTAFLQSGQALPAESGKALTQLALTCVDIRPELVKQLESAVAQGLLHHQFFQLRAPAPEAAAYVALLCIWLRPGLQPVNPFQNSAPGEQQVRELLADPDSQPVIASGLRTAIISTGAIQIWLALVRQNPTLEKITAWMARDNEFLVRLMRTTPPDQIRDLADRLGQIYSTVGGESDVEWKRRVVQALSGEQHFLSNVAGQIKGPEDNWLAALTLAMNRQGDEAVSTASIQMLSRLTESQWEPALKQFSWHVAILQLLINREIAPNLGREFRKAVAKLITSAASNTSYSSLGAEHVTILLRSLEKTLRISLEDDVYEEVTHNTTSHSAAYWILAAPAFIESIHRNKSKQRATRRLLWPLARERNFVGLAWLGEFLNHNSIAALDDEDPDAVADFKSEIELALQDSALDQPQKHLLESIRTRLRT